MSAYDLPESLSSPSKFYTDDPVRVLGKTLNEKTSYKVINGRLMQLNATASTLPSTKRKRCHNNPREQKIQSYPGVLPLASITDYSSEPASPIGLRGMEEMEAFIDPLPGSDDVSNIAMSPWPFIKTDFYHKHPRLESDVSAAIPSFTLQPLNLFAFPKSI